MILLQEDSAPRRIMLEISRGSLRYEYQYVSLHEEGEPSNL